MASVNSARRTLVAAANPRPGCSTKLRRCVLADVLARAANKVRLSGIGRIPTTRTEQCQSLTAHLTTPDSRRSMCAKRGLLLRPSTVRCLPVAPAAQVEPARVGPLAPPCPTDLSLRDRHPALDDPARPSLPASRTPVNRSVRLRRRALRPHIPDEGACPRVPVIRVAGVNSGHLRPLLAYIPRSAFAHVSFLIVGRPSKLAMPRSIPVPGSPHSRAAQRHDPATATSTGSNNSAVRSSTRRPRHLPGVLAYRRVQAS